MWSSLLRKAVVSISLLSLSFLLGCGTSPSGSDSGPKVATGLSVSPKTASVPDGSTQKFTAIEHYSNGTTQDVTAGVIWTSSSMAVADPTSAGVVQTNSVGQTTITATLGSFSSTAVLTVSPAVAKSIQISPSTPMIPLGSSQTFVAMATYTDGTMHNISNSVQWTASPSTVLSIGSTGTATSLKQGSFSITATAGTATTTISGTVGVPVPQSLQVNPSSASAAKGATQIFHAILTSSDGSTQDVTATASWQSGDTSIASITAPGLANAVAPGTTQIQATLGAVSGSAAFTVNNATVQSVQISPLTASIAKGTILAFVAKALLSDGSSQDVSSSATWSSSALTVCTVSVTGVATAKGLGSCVVSAVYGGSTGTATLGVSAATLVSVTFTPANPVVPSGGVLQLKATGTFSDGTTQDVTSSLTYLSSKPLVLAVLPGGLLTGIIPGTATVTATLGSFSTTLSVTVGTATLQSLSILPISVSIAAGTSTQLALTGTYSDGSTQDLTATATWASSANNVIAVNADGNVTGLATGDATVTAAVGAISFGVDVVVTPATVVAISINPPSVTVALGQQLALTASAALSDGTSQDVTASVHWSVTNPLLAGISNDLGNPGVLTALLAGTSTVNASINGVSGSATITVDPATLVSLSITPNVLSLPLGIPSQLSVTGVFSDGSTQDLTASVQWSSSNGGVLGISLGGLVTPLTIGNSTVTASLTGVSATTAVSVSAANLVSISLGPLSISLPLGLTVQLHATGTYSDGSTQDISAQVHWGSSSLLTATVGNSGLLLAIGAGNANVTATVGSVTQTLPIQVTAAVLESVAVTAGQNSLALGFSTQLTAIGTYSDASTQDLSASVTWSSSIPGVATVASAGLLSTLSVGGSTITATFQGVEGTLPISVTSATLLSISISPNNVSLVAILLQQQFTVTGHFSDGSTQVLTSGIHWSVTNAIVAIVNQTGLLTAIGVGNASVTATYGTTTTSATVSIL
jgi:hypothetical protein